MANTKKTSTKINKRQPAKSQLPFKTGAKKQRVATPTKRMILRQVRIPLGPKIHIQVQLGRTVKTKVPTKVKQTGKPLGARVKHHPIAATLVTAGLAGTIFFAADLIRQPIALVTYTPPVAITEILKPAEQPQTIYQLNKSEPLSIAIADVGIDAPLISVGKRTDDTMEVPNEVNVPAWYRLSPTPGELGPSVIVGHVDGESGPAIFWRLRELIPGQIIEIKRADNSKARFEVLSVQQFEQKSFPTDAVYGNIDHAGLRLITCGGTFNRITRHYSHNTVVYAKLLNETLKVEQKREVELPKSMLDFNALGTWPTKENLKPNGYLPLSLNGASNESQKYKRILSSWY